MYGFDCRGHFKSGNGHAVKVLGVAMSRWKLGVATILAAGLVGPPGFEPGTNGL